VKTKAQENAWREEIEKVKYLICEKLVGVFMSVFLVVGHHDQVVMANGAILLGRLWQNHLNFLSADDAVKIWLDHWLRRCLRRRNNKKEHA